MFLLAHFLVSPQVPISLIYVLSMEKDPSIRIAWVISDELCILGLDDLYGLILRQMLDRS